MSCPLNTLCHLTYDYQFLKPFPPILDNLHSKFSGRGHPQHVAQAYAFDLASHFKLCSAGPVKFEKVCRRKVLLANAVISVLNQLQNRYENRMTLDLAI